MSQRKFKAGDRVYFAGNRHSEADSGTVMPTSPVDGLFPYEVWVKWDSDGRTLSIDEDDLRYEATEGVAASDEQLSVESCLDFLVSKGYTVTLGKK